MKFKTTPYHFDLLKDQSRLSTFFEAIYQYNSNNELAYDLGCGSGVLSYFLANKFNEIIAIEIDNKASQCAKDNLANFSNISVINEDVLQYDFIKKADLIVCEMLDTALIDEEEIPVLNKAKQFLKKDATIIPQGVINIAQLVSMEREYIHWDENAGYEIISNEVIYNEINFLDEINPNFEGKLSFEITKDAVINGILITTITKLNDNIVCGPTPMLNPPLLIPIEKKHAKCNDLINVKLKYIMGKGIETIQTSYD